MHAGDFPTRVTRDEAAPQAVAPLPVAVRTWAQFDRHVHRSGRPLLARLDAFADSVLVAGCQRSGTTALSRLITATAGMVDFQFGHDEELDAALILSGAVEHHPAGRYCFQTTYLNDHWPEYLEHDDYRLLWVLRNPASVVLSMLTNWRRGALRRLFRHTGSKRLEAAGLRRYQRFGALGVPRLRMACLSYAAKTAQVLELHRRLPAGRLLVLDYDRLIVERDTQLPQVYAFIGAPWRDDFGAALHAGSLAKADRFHEQHRALLDTECMPVYEEARALALR